MRARLAIAALVFGLVATVSYTVQLGWSAATDPGPVMASEHVPLYWRMALAAVHGLAAGGAAGLGVPSQWTSRVLSAIPVVAAVVIAACAVVMAVLR